MGEGRVCAGGYGPALDRAKELEGGGRERTVHVGPSFFVGGGPCGTWDTGGKGQDVGRGSEVPVYEAATSAGGGKLS